MQAMMTKEEDEIERIRKMGRITTEVVAEAADYLSSRKVKKGILHKKNGDPLRIRDVKRKIDLWLAERGLKIRNRPYLRSVRMRAYRIPQGIPKIFSKPGKRSFLIFSPARLVEVIFMILRVPGASDTRPIPRCACITTSVLPTSR